jgi:5'-methylthioadenosine phosphorylase
LGQLAIIGGSQAYALIQGGRLTGELLGIVATPFGESQPVFRLTVKDRHILFMSRHGVEGYSIAAPWVNYRANIWALKELGATQIVSWSGPGAIDQTLEIGQFVLPDDLIDETKSRAHSFFEGAGWGFVRQNPVFCSTLRTALSHTLADLDVHFRDYATYVCTEGPRLETPAEIRKFKSFGGDLVGMTLVPEVFLAKELEMHYASICYVTNYAEGLRDRPFNPGVLFEGLLDEDERRAVDAAVSRFPEIIALLAERLDSVPASCYCDKLMERYRRRGDIGPDWHTWIRAPRGDV